MHLSRKPLAFQLGPLSTPNGELARPSDQMTFLAQLGLVPQPAKA